MTESIGKKQWTITLVKIIDHSCHGKLKWGKYMLNPLCAKFFRWNKKHIFTFYDIPPHWHDSGSWNPSSSKTRIYLFYIVNIMGADVLARSLDFSNHDIYYVKPFWFSPHMLRVKTIINILGVTVEWKLQNKGLTQIWLLKCMPWESHFDSQRVQCNAECTLSKCDKNCFLGAQYSIKSLILDTPNPKT